MFISSSSHLFGTSDDNMARRLILTLTLIPPPDIIDSDDGWYIFTSISQNNTPVAYLLAIYAPAHRAPRRHFFEKLVKHTLLTDQLTTLDVPVFILGDFNYDTTNDAIQRLYPNWLPFLRTHFIDCFKDAKQPTFSSNIGSRSTIDYIYCCASAHTFVKSVKHTYMPYDWTDHELLSIHYQLDFDSESSTRRGRGAWKANPFLGNVPSYRSGLAQHITKAINERQHFNLQDTDTAMRIWGELKEEIKTFTRSFQLDRNTWRHRSIKKLQSKRNRILRDYKNTGILSLLLPSLEALLGKLQEEQAEIDVLNAFLPIYVAWTPPSRRHARYLFRGFNRYSCGVCVLLFCFAQTWSVLLWIQISF
ncbi:hypothetical protein [Parasitella parasitica]|uniref:Endonuclease/exonuclease/phosphatase domain-containing protein n=1 Tax=Parasitella parasitica TaxID=35722 RepID=A0A0B7NCV0_9FUNG|nr:hypothetical protein [Parasitella parasitica]